MKKKNILVYFLIVFFGVELEAQELSHSFGLNVGQPALIFPIGLALKDPTGDGIFLPLHFSYERDDWQYQFIYRYDAHGTFRSYHEFLAVVGKRFTLNEAWTWGTGLGAGYVSGELNNRFEDFDGSIIEEGEAAPYTCLQATASVDVRSRQELGSNWSMDYGVGLLGILPIGCEGTPEWSALGILIHRLHPVVNLSFSKFF